MSVVIPIDSLSDKKKKIIQDCLLLQPVSSQESHFMMKTTFPLVKDPLFFYLRDQTNYTVPYFFGKHILKYKQHVHTPTMPMTFTSQLRDYQLDAVEKGMHDIGKYGSTIFGLYCGFGKTIIGAYCASQLEKLTVILVQNTQLVPQWETTFNDHTNGVCWRVGDKDSYFTEKTNVMICMDKRVHKIPEEIRKKVGTVIVDEAHLFCTPDRVKALLAFQPEFVMAMTATFKRPDGMEQMMEAMCGSPDIGIGIFITAQKPYQVVKLVTSFEPESVKNRQGTLDWNALVNSLVENEERNKLIIDIIKKNQKHKILVITKRVKHAEHMIELLEQEGIKGTLMAGNVKGCEESRVIVGSVSKIGTGWDEANYFKEYSGEKVNMLLLTVSIKEQSSFEQVRGRVMRSDNPIVMYMVDQHATIKRHFSKLKKWMEETNGTIQEVHV